jgi:hypothetical protein
MILPQDRTLTVNEVRQMARVGRRRVHDALRSGALLPAMINPGAVGRTPAYLVSVDEARRWVAAGAPVGPEAAEHGA